MAVDARAFVEDFVATIVHEDAHRYASFYAERAVMRTPLGEALDGRGAIRAAEGELFAAFGEISVDVLSVVFDGQTIAIEAILRAVNDGPLKLGGDPVEPTAQRVEIPAAWFLELDDEGKIVSERDYFDTSVFIRQLGIGPG